MISRVSWATSQDNTKYPSVMRLSVLVILVLEQELAKSFSHLQVHTFRWVSTAVRSSQILPDLITSFGSCKHEFH